MEVRGGVPTKGEGGVQGGHPGFSGLSTFFACVGVVIAFCFQFGLKIENGKDGNLGPKSFWHT